ncbi:MAG: tRNA (guanosine(46)-N7)-methyltransferase TrmB [Alphaproteobacteria bacterium]|nr:tRNA (guanosine(46)-N7)-methyltransferase TrmB [Alphaproteobacteria bacterium]
MISTERSSSRLFGRRKGRPLHVRKSLLIKELLPKLAIELKGDGPVCPQDFFQGAGQAQGWMEIGFGGGEHLAAQAKLHPENVYIGCEPFLNGVASLLDHVDREAITNIRVFDNDARLVLDALKDNSLDGCFVLFPDPWPKKRHIERRFIGPENLDRLARVLKRGGLLRVASDHSTLIEWMHGCLQGHAGFACAHEGHEPPADWVSTRYQQKAVEAGRQPFFMDYKRK